MKSKLPIEPQCSNTIPMLTRHPTRSVSLKLLTRPTASFQIRRPGDLMIRRPLPAAARPEPAGEAESLWDFFTCDGCGKVDVHSRCATFFKVFSIIFYSQAKPVGGVLCPECRSRVATSSAIFSAFLGPWALWGIVFTLRSLFASLRGGELPRQQNAQLLRHQGIAFLQRGFINEARTALVASLRFERNPQVVDQLNEDVFRVSTVLPGPSWSKGQTLAAFFVRRPTHLSSRTLLVPRQ